ncbi:hypothetical protein AAHA92_26239 [Salvia divinorum]|uniref:Uncharacterized protein n=1 Tax=Salvia divinorum TaxID=28513 RepID=A0ABD1GGC4_SALDI
MHLPTAATVSPSCSLRRAHHRPHKKSKRMLRRKKLPLAAILYSHFLSLSAGCDRAETKIVRFSCAYVFTAIYFDVL